MIKILKKIFHQPRRSFPTTDPIAYQLKPNFVAQLIGIKPLSTLMYIIPKWRKAFTQLDTNERIIEVPFIFNQLPKNKKIKILDVGCCETIMPIQLASLGYRVTGVDLRPYELTHPNFSFVKTDICQNSLPQNNYDLATCVSALEHMGLDTIYGKSDQQTSDKKALKAIFNLLKPKGKLFLTVPAANKFSRSEFMRIYTPKKLNKLLEKFKIIEINYFSPDSKRLNWQPCSQNKMPDPANFGVATIIAQKPACSKK